LADYGFIDTDSGNNAYFLPYVALVNSATSTTSNLGLDNVDGNRGNYDYVNWAFDGYNQADGRVSNEYYSTAFCLLEMSYYDSLELLDSDYLDLT